MNSFVSLNELGAISEGAEPNKPLYNRPTHIMVQRCIYSPTTLHVKELLNMVLSEAAIQQSGFRRLYDCGIGHELLSNALEVPSISIAG